MEKRHKPTVLVGACISTDAKSEGNLARFTKIKTAHSSDPTIPLPGISPPVVLAQGHKDACGCGFRGSRKLGTSKMLISCIKNMGHPWPEKFCNSDKDCRWTIHSKAEEGPL